MKRTLTWNTGRPSKGQTEVYYIDAFSDKYRFILAKCRVDGEERYRLTRQKLGAKATDFESLGVFESRIMALNAAEDNLK